METIQNLRNKLNCDLKRAFPLININEKYQFVKRLGSPFMNQIFIVDDKYHLFTTGWRESEAIEYVFDCYDDLFWLIADNYVFNSIKWSGNRDVCYEKEIELMTKISKEFGERKRIEIEKRRSKQ